MKKWLKRGALCIVFFGLVLSDYDCGPFEYRSTTFDKCNELHTYISLANGLMYTKVPQGEYFTVLSSLEVTRCDLWELLIWYTTWIAACGVCVWDILQCGAASSDCIVGGHLHRPTDFPLFPPTQCHCHQCRSAYHSTSQIMTEHR